MHEEETDGGQRSTPRNRRCRRADGTVPPHILHFQTRGGLQMSVEIDEITGGVAVRDGYLEFYEAEESEFDMLGGAGVEGR